jgi:hypothetical protein
MPDPWSVQPTVHDGTAAARPSPADAFFAGFRQAAAGVRFTALAEDEAELARVAAAFTTAGARTEAWCRERLGWTDGAARHLAQAFALTAGGWLLAGSGDLDVLERELALAWRAFGESHLH